MKIQLTDIGVKRCESECLLASGLKTFSTGGGIIDMEINLAALEWVADYLLPFGSNATVLEPVELIKLVQPCLNSGESITCYQRPLHACEARRRHRYAVVSQTYR